VVGKKERREKRRESGGRDIQPIIVAMSRELPNNIKGNAVKRTHAVYDTANTGV
jgi:hypothetical protein